MAAPRVFISSTCYDLAAERDTLSDFCGTWGFDTTLSERGDIFYHPDLHTHESCVRETSNCQLFILIIGGRFGGNYVIDPKKSITNAEYSAAAQNGTPVFTFVKQEVLNDHNLWQRNKEKAFALDITYPSIDKQEHALDIFKFVDEVRHAPSNNGIFGFKLAKDINAMLRKQWAGMMFEYLQMRSVSKQLAMTHEAVGNLAVVSNKIEELVKKIYINVDVNNASQAIIDIDEEGHFDEFLSTIASRLDDPKFIIENLLEADWEPPTQWWKFLQDVTACEVAEVDGHDDSVGKAVLDYSKTPIAKISGFLTKAEEIDAKNLQEKYSSVGRLGREPRLNLLRKYLWTNVESARVRESTMRLTRKPTRK